MVKKHSIILEFLKDKGYSYSRIAREIGVSVALVRAVAIGERRNEKVESFIQNVMGVAEKTDLNPEGPEA